MPGRQYFQVATIGLISIYNALTNPNGGLDAVEGSLAIQGGTGTGNIIVWQNADGGTAWVPIDITYAFMLEALLTRGYDAVDILANLDQNTYADVADIPAGNIALTQWAIVNKPGPISLVRQLAWSLTGEVIWTATDWPYIMPPDPLGTWFINANDNTIATGSNAWQFYMGTRFHVTAAGNGLDLKRIAFKNAIGGNAHRWQIRKSTITGAAPPPLSSYTTIVDSGIVTIPTGNDWEDITLGVPIPLAQDEWYVIWYWVGTGGQFAALPLNPGQTDLTFADQIAGVFRSAPGVFPGPALPTFPQTQTTNTLYGPATGGIG